MKIINNKMVLGSNIVIEPFGFPNRMAEHLDSSVGLSDWAPDEVVRVATLCSPVLHATGISSGCLLILGKTVHCPLGFWIVRAGVAMMPWQTSVLGDG